MSKILVTGGAGFIGSHIVDKLVEAGHQVDVLDNLSSGRKEFVRREVTLHEMDIRSAEAAALVEKLAPDVIVHAAAQISVRVSMDDPVLDTDLNVKGFVNLLSPLRSLKNRHVVFLSSGGAVYGEQEKFPADESHPIRPESVYGLAKRVGELYLEMWARAWGLTYTSLRLSNVYGPRQNPHGEAGVVAIFVRGLLEGKNLTINGTGEQTRDFVFVEDVAAAVGCAVKARKVGHFNIGTGKETSINALTSSISEAVGVGGKIGHGEGKLGEQMRSCITPAAAKVALGWEPSVQLRDGIGKTVAWFRKELVGAST